jgi:hypothetical protein
MSIKKHVGKVKSSDHRCVIVFMQLPEDKEKALVISTENLPPRYEQMLMEVVDSNEGQNEKDLAKAMSRRMVPETGRTVLAEFHSRGLLRAEPVDNIIMLPRPNTPFPLRSLLEQMGALSVADGLASASTNNAASDVKFNQITANQAIGKNEERISMARNLLMEAEMLQSEANKKREQAFKHAPSLRPQQVAYVPEPKTVVEVPPVAEPVVETAEKRRGRAPKSTSTGE